MNVDSGLTVGKTIMKKRASLGGMLIVLFFVLASKFFPAPTFSLGGGIDITLEVFLFFGLLVASLFRFLMMRIALEKELLFTLLLPSVGLLYLGYGLFVEQNNTQRAFFEYRYFMFYLSALFPLIFLRTETDAEFIFKGIVYSSIVFLPFVLLQQFSLKSVGYIFLPGGENIGKEWLAEAVRFVPAAQCVLLFGAIYAYLKAIRSHTYRNIIVALLFVVALSQTYSRGLWLVYLAGVIFVSWFEKQSFLKRFHSFPLMAAVISALVFFIYISGFSEPILNRLGMISTSAVSTDMSLKWRIYETEEAIKAIQASPVVGHGLGYEYHRSFAFAGDGYYIHNTYLYLLVKMGLPGLFAMLVFMAAFIKTAFAEYKDNKKNEFVSDVALVSAAFMTAMVLEIAIMPGFVSSVNIIVFISIIFGVIAFLRINRRKKSMATKV